MEMTIEQQRAVAMANARMRMSEAEADSPPPDPYHEAAQARFNDLKAKGVPVESTYGERVGQGASLGGLDELSAAVMTPGEMIRNRTWDPREGYKHAKAFENVRLEDARKRQGALGSAAEIAGGVGTGIGAARQGLSLLRPGAGALARTGMLAGEGAIYGGTSGFLEGGDTLEDRAKGAAKGAAIGGTVGAVLPPVASVIGAVVSPVVSNIRARINPQGVAASQVARAFDESGQRTGTVLNQVRAANREGQPEFTVADALGNPGQRLLYTAASAPGPGRTNVANFLEGRQMGQGRRVANQVAEAFDAPLTAQQAESLLNVARTGVSNVNYGAARAGAGPVDTAPVIAAIDNIVPNVARPHGTLANDPIEQALVALRARLANNQTSRTDFNSIHRIRSQLSDDVEAAARAGRNNQARLMGGVLRELDTALEAASPGFRAANQQHAAMSRNIEAVGEGRTAAQRGRSEDVVRGFQAMAPQAQQPFRVGYADRLIEAAQAGAPGVNKARFVAPEAELAAIAAQGRAPQLLRQLGRENTMFQTRHTALGGSRTAENLADQGALRVDPGLVRALMTGDFGGAARRGLAYASNALHGNTPAVREQIAQLLLQRGPRLRVETAVRRERQQLQRNAAIAAALLRGTTQGTAVTAGLYQRNR